MLNDNGAVHLKNMWAHVYFSWYHMIVDHKAGMHGTEADIESDDGGGGGVSCYVSFKFCSFVYNEKEMHWLTGHLG